MGTLHNGTQLPLQFKDEIYEAITRYPLGVRSIQYTPLEGQPLLN